jgi:hypothetical protein
MLRYFYVELAELFNLVQYFVVKGTLQGFVAIIEHAQDMTSVSLQYNHLCYSCL